MEPVSTGSEATLNRPVRNPSHSQHRLKTISVVRPLIGIMHLSKWGVTSEFAKERFIGNPAFPWVDVCGIASGLV